MRPRRPILGCIAWPGPVSLLFMSFTVVGASFLVGVLPPNTKAEVVIPFALVVAWGLGRKYDTPRSVKRHAAALAPYGFERCGIEHRDPEVEAVAVAMGPELFRPKEPPLVVMGDLRGRTVYLATYASARPFVFVAVQTARHWPDAIVQRKRLFGDSRHSHQIDNRAFSRQRELITDTPTEVAHVFEPLSDWFVSDDTVRKSFRMHETPGKNEVWSFRGHWVALGDFGHAGPKQLLQIADFLVAFAEDADDSKVTAMSEPTASSQTDQ